jgi:EmrB/QacA subfamily drug resistance transporter
MTTSAVRAPAPTAATPTKQAPSPGPGGLSHRQIMTILTGLLLGMFLAALDLTIVSTSIRTIADDLNGLSIQAWVTTAYLITSTLSTPLYGKLSDLYGRKPFYIAAISIFVIGSAASAFSTSMYMLAAFRAFQGLGAGGLMSLAFTILGDIVSPRQRAKYQGYFLAVFGVSSVLGPVIGGALAGAPSILGIVGWRWVFLVNVPIGFVALVVVAKVLNVPFIRKVNPRIDWWGALTLVIGLVPLLIVASQGQTWGWGDPKSLICYAVGALGVIAFIVTERLMGQHAMIPLRLFRSGTFSMVILASVLIGVAMFGAMTLIPQYLQIVKGSSPTLSGLQTLPMMVGLMGASIVSGQITSRTGRYKIFPVLGTVIIGGGGVLLATLGADTPLWQPMLYMFVIGAGLGLCMQTLQLSAQNAGPIQDMGVATSSATFFRQIGATLGVAVFLSILFGSVTTKIGSALGSAFHTTPFQAALHDPNVLANPNNQAVVSMITGHGGSANVLSDSSFLQKIDPRLAHPFLVGFSGSIDIVFWLLAAVMVVAFFVTLFTKEIPLRNMSGVQAMAEGAESLIEAPAEVSAEAPRPEPVGVGGRHALPGANSSVGFAGNGTGNGTGSGGNGNSGSAGTSVTGAVRRPDSGPVAGVMLTLINHAGQQVDRATTGPDGEFRMTAPLDGSYVLIASSPGHQPHASPLRVAGAGLRQEIVLTGTARAVGTVRTAGSGTVVAGAIVTLTDQRGEVVGATTTGPDGRYLFDELGRGGHTLVVTAPDHRPAAVTLAVADSGDTVTDVEISGAAHLAGIARGAAGRSVPDARVTLVDSSGNVVAMTTTDGEGGYAFADLPEGDYTVIASGYPPVTSRQTVAAGADQVHDVLLSHSEL